MSMTPLEKAIKIIVDTASPNKIILFGSRSKSDFRPDSDYDLLVLKNNITQIRKLTQQIYLNFKDIGAAIDIIMADIDKFEELKNDPYMIYYEAAKNGKVVYDKARES